MVVHLKFNPLTRTQERCEKGYRNKAGGRYDWDLVLLGATRGTIRALIMTYTSLGVPYNIQDPVLKIKALVLGCLPKHHSLRLGRRRSLFRIWKLAECTA